VIKHEIPSLKQQIIRQHNICLFLWCNSPHCDRVSSLSRLHDDTQTNHTR